MRNIASLELCFTKSTSHQNTSQLERKKPFSEEKDLTEPKKEKNDALSVAIGIFKHSTGYIDKEDVSYA